MIKNRLIIILFVFISITTLFFTGCGKETGKGDTESKYLEESLTKSETSAGEFESKYILPDIPHEVNSLIRTCKHFEETYPGDERVSKVLSVEGEAYYFFKHYDKALNAYREIYENYPETDEYISACEKIAKINFDMGNYSEAERWYAITREVSQERGKEDVLERVTQLEAASSFKKAESIGIDVTSDLPKEEISPELIKKAQEQARLFEETADKNPGTEIGTRSLFKAAETYTKIQDWENVARIYLKFAKEYPDDERSPDAIASAAQSYEKLEMYEKAGETYEKLVEVYGEEEYIDVLFLAGEDYYKAENWRKAEELFRRYRESPNAMDAGNLITSAYKMAKAQENQGDMDDAFKSYQDCVEIYAYAKENQFEVTDFALYPAESQFIIAEDIFDDYMDIELIMPEDVMARNLEKKVELNKQLDTMYNRVISYKVRDWLTAPIYRLGQISENFADTLRGAEYPPDLTPEQFAMYAAQLEEQALPLEEKAVEYYNNLLAIAEKYEISDKWTVKARERLIALNPGIYAGVEDFSGKDIVSDTSWKVNTTSPSPDWNTSNFDNSIWISAEQGSIEEKHIDDITNFNNLQGSQFIWAPVEGEKPPQVVYFTKKLSFHKQPAPREVRISAKEHYKFYVNGVLVGQDDYEEGDEWENAELYDISPYLQVGDNMLAVEAMSKSDDEYWLKFECYETGN